MNLTEGIYPDNMDKKYNRGAFLSDADRQFAVNNMHHKLEKVYNDHEKSFLQRRLTMPSSLNFSNQFDHNNSGLTKLPLRRWVKMGNIHHTCPEQLEFKAVLVYKCIKNSQMLDAVNYVYLGSLHGGPSLQQGMTLDRQGNLLLIKGKSKDFFKSGWLNLTGDEKFHVAKIDMGKNSPLQFSRLIISHEGKLIAWEKHKNFQYEIKLDVEDISKEISIDHHLDIMVCINVQITKILLPIEKNPSLQFFLNKDNAVKFYFFNGAIYLSEIRNDKCQYKYDLLRYKLKLPLSAGSRIVSANKVGNHVKLCIEQDRKTRIMYFSPHYVDLQTCAVKHLSHKPVQNFYSGTGVDPHEKVYSGLPFDSMRWGNFSSKHIPILSSVIDNFRVNLKKAKNLHFAGDNYRAGLSLAKAVDPGLQCLAETMKEKVSRKKPLSTGLTQRHGVVHQISQLSEFVQNKRLNGVFSLANDYLAGADSLAEKLKLSLSLLAENDSISLNTFKNTAFFFGIAAAGMPFVTGWFAGALARLGKHHSLTLTKNESGNIFFNFIKNSTNSLVLLAGTGQGLEDKGKFLTAKGIDYGTLLPLEANLILAHNCEVEHNFSFEIRWCDIDHFLETLFKPGVIDRQVEDWVKNATLKINRDKDVTLSLEAKSELRGQIGFMANPYTFLVIPRTALGLAGTINFFNIAKKESETISKFGDTNIRNTEKSLKTNYLDSSLNVFNETKVMPIPMTGLNVPGDKILCYPLPLIEELNQRLPYTGNELARHFRLDGAFLQLKFASLCFAASDKTDVAEGNTNSAGTRDADPDFADRPLFDSRAYDSVAGLIDSIERELHRADTDDHGYQSIQPGINLGSFVISPGDFKRNLRSAAKNRTPQVNPFAHKVKPSVRMRIKRALRPWTKNTTLREYLAQQAREMIANVEPAADPRHTAFDFIRAIEKYAARSDRKSNGKKSTVMAVATYRLQKHTIKLLRNEFSLLCHAVWLKTRAGQSIDGERTRLRELRALLRVEKSGKEPYYQLDHIALVRQNAITLEVSTLPCTLLHVARKNELVYSKSLSTINFEYREGELFPYKFISSVKIMPELFF